MGRESGLSRYYEPKIVAPASHLVPDQSIKMEERQKRDSQDVLQLNQDVQGRSNGVLKGVAKGIADDRRAVSLGLSATKVPLLDVLLGLSLIHI